MISRRALKQIHIVYLTVTYYCLTWILINPWIGKNWIFKIWYSLTISLQVTFRELNKIDHQKPTAAQTRFCESRFPKFLKVLNRARVRWNFLIQIEKFAYITLTRPLRRTLRMRWFILTDLTDPTSDFWCASFGKYQFVPFQLSFNSRFYINIIFWLRWFYSLFEQLRLKRKKLCLFTLTIG